MSLKLSDYLNVSLYLIIHLAPNTQYSFYTGRSTLGARRQEPISGFPTHASGLILEPSNKYRVFVSLVKYKTLHKYDT